MKLISCYIENFGAIAKKQIGFDERLTSVCEENGCGKTTLAAFLEAMFYGMDSDRANSREFGARRHFYPFTGGRFGGNVVFSAGGNVYKIERYFDEKSESKDSVTVYKNNELQAGSDGQIGEKIFGIDKPSFERTIFIDAREIEIASTGSINAKLNRFLEGGTDETNAENALLRLEKTAKEYKKSRAGNDLITQENDRLLELNEKIANFENIKASLPEKYRLLAEYDGELQALQKSLDGRQKAALLQKDWEQYDAYLSAAATSEKTMRETEEKYPFGIPSSAEIGAVKKALSAREALKGQAVRPLSEEDAAALSSMRRKYAEGVPAETELAELAEKINALSAAETELKLEENAESAEYENSLREKFAAGVRGDRRDRRRRSGCRPRRKGIRPDPRLRYRARRADARGQVCFRKEKVPRRNDRFRPRRRGGNRNDLFLPRRRRGPARRGRTRPYRNGIRLSEQENRRAPLL